MTRSRTLQLRLKLAMPLLRPLALLALVFLVLGPLLFVIEKQTAIASSNVTAIAIVLIATCYWTYSLIMLSTTKHMATMKSALSVYALLGFSLLRLLVCILLIVGYAVIVKNDIVCFIINVLAFHLTTLLATGAAQMKQNKPLNSNRNDQTK